MKKITTSLLLAASSMFFFSACSVNHTLQRAETLPTQTTEKTEGGSFVRFKNGHMLYCQSLELKKGVFVSPYLLGDGWYKIKAGDVDQYQINGELAVSESRLEDDRSSRVAKDALPGFAIRSVSGSLNVYQRKLFNGRTTYDRYYIQWGNEGQIVKYSPDALKKMLNEHHALSGLPELPTDPSQLSAYVQQLSKVRREDWLTVLE
jgi:hypothetical protein